MLTEMPKDKIATGIESLCNLQLKPLSQVNILLYYVLIIGTYGIMFVFQCRLLYLVRSKVIPMVKLTRVCGWTV